MPICGLHSVVLETQSFTTIPVMTDFSKQTVKRVKCEIIVDL